MYTFYYYYTLPRIGFRSGLVYQFHTNKCRCNMTHQEKTINQIKEYIKEKCFSSPIINPLVLVNQTNYTLWCNRTFDSVYCWPETPAGVLAIQPCQNHFIKSYNKDAFATKQCTENGTWLKRPDLENKSWTNLTQCGGIYIHDPNQKNETINEIYDTWVPIIKDAVYVGYVISLISLVLALLIFITIRRLHCERNKLHIHLFASSVFRAATFIFKDVLFVKGTALLNDASYDAHGELYYNYTWMCKFFISMRYYSIITNFMFMLMEGLYLHNLIFLNLFSENHGTNCYCLLGWGVPIWFVIPWVFLRIYLENTRCWTQSEVKFIVLLIEVPIALTVVINFVLFILIVRVLVLKLNFTSAFVEHKKKYRKLLKSTLTLIPLFGIPYFISLILSFYIHASIILEIWWMFFDQTFTAFQGFFAALVYCFLNTEVQGEIKRKYLTLRHDKELRRSRTISCNTQQFSLQNNDENLDLFRAEEEDVLRGNGHENHKV